MNLQDMGRFVYWDRQVVYWARDWVCTLARHEGCVLTTCAARERVGNGILRLSRLRDERGGRKMNVWFTKALTMVEGPTHPVHPTVGTTNQDSFNPETQVQSVTNNTSSHRPLDPCVYHTVTKCLCALLM